jgi:hypothetical protein
MVDHNQIVDKQLKEIGSNNNMDNIVAFQGDKLVVDFVLLVDLLIVVCQLTVDY